MWPLNQLNSTELSEIRLLISNVAVNTQSRVLFKKSYKTESTPLWSWKCFGRFMSHFLQCVWTGQHQLQFEKGVVSLSPVKFSAKLAFKYRLNSSNEKLRTSIRVLSTLQYESSRKESFFQLLCGSKQCPAIVGSALTCLWDRSVRKQQSFLWRRYIFFRRRRFTRRLRRKGELAGKKGSSLDTLSSLDCKSSNWRDYFTSRWVNSLVLDWLIKL